MNLKSLAFLALCFLFSNAGAQVVTTSVVPITSTTIGRYEKFEAGIALNTVSFNNQFDPDEIEVYAVFKFIPSGATQRVNGFWLRDYIQDDASPDPTVVNSCTIKASDVDDPDFLTPIATGLPWRIRFAPNFIGDWSYQIFVRSGGQTTVSGTFYLTCTTSDNKGYISVGSNNTHFVYKDARDPKKEVSFIPLAVNTMENPRISRVFNRAHYKYTKMVMEKLASVHGNTIRIFMSPEQFGIEWDEDGLGKYSERQNRAFTLDRIFELAEELDIKIQLVLISNHEFHYNAFPDYDYWLHNPYKTLLPGSNNANQLDFFNNQACIRYFKNRLRYVIARWGYSSSILAYEIWNETMLMENASPTIWDNGNSLIVDNWFNNIVTYARSLDNRHMYTNSGGGPGFFNFGNAPLDYVQDHYYSNDKNVLFNLSVFAQYSVKTYKKPYLCGEYGILGQCFPINFAYNILIFLPVTMHTTGFNFIIACGQDCSAVRPVHPTIGIPESFLIPAVGEPIRISVL